MEKMKFLDWYRNVLGQTGKNLFTKKLYLFLFLIFLRVKYDDNDVIIVITGDEGSGKSTLGIQVSSVLDPSFNIERVNLEPEGFINDLRTLKKAKATQYDESSTGLFSRQAMSKMNTILIKMFTLIRAKNLFIILCIPDFFILDKYLRDVRVFCLIHVTKKGRLEYYDKPLVDKISQKSNWENVMKDRAINPLFTNEDFNKGFPDQVSYQEYKEKKMESTNRVIDELSVKVTPKKSQSLYLRLPDVSQQLGVVHDTALGYVKSGKWKGSKDGGRWFMSRKEFERIKEEREKTETNPD